MKHATQIILAVGFATLLTTTWLFLLGLPRSDSLPSVLHQAVARAALLDQMLPQPLREALNPVTPPAASPLPITRFLGRSVGRHGAADGHGGGYWPARAARSRCSPCRWPA